MVLDYLPFDINLTREFIEDCGYIDIISREKIIDDLIDKRFCKYVYKSGKYKGYTCLRKIKSITGFGEKPLCHTHKYQKNRIKKEVILCSYDNCKRRVKQLGFLCYLHVENKDIHDDFVHNSVILHNNYRKSYIEDIIDESSNETAFDKPTLYPYEYPVNLKKLKIYIYDNYKKDKCILFCKDRINILNNDIEKYLLFLKRKKIIYLKIKSLIKFNYIFKKIKKNVKNDVSASTFTIFSLNDKYFLEFYLSSLKYISETTNSVFLLRSNINNILNILKNNLSLDINESYLELVDEHTPKHKVYIEEITDEQQVQVDNKHVEYNDFLSENYKYNINKIKIKDSYNNNGYKYLKLIKYDVFEKKKNNKKYNKKYNKSLKRLYKINMETFQWMENNIKTNKYKYRILNLINACMDEFHDYSLYDSENKMEHLRNVYKYIYIELTQNIEVCKPVTKIEKKDYEILLNKNWKEYSNYND